MRFILFIAMLVFYISAAPSFSFAFDCETTPLNESAIQQAEIIFEGVPVTNRELTFTERAKLWKAGNRDAGATTVSVYEFTVSKEWKNALAGQTVEVLLNTYWGNDFALNDEGYLVVSDRKQAGFYIIDLCGHTMPLKYYKGDSPVEKLRGTMSLLEDSVGYGAHIKIKRSDQTCSVDSDCDAIPTDCGGCDCGVMVNKSALDHYTQLYQNTCEAIGEIAHCEIFCDMGMPLCIDGYCSLN